MIEQFRSRKQIVAPAVPAVQLLADHLRLDQIDQPELLEDYFTAALRNIEQLTWRSLLTATWRVTLDAWPCEQTIELPYAPLIEVLSVQYRDAAGALQTLDEDLYEVDTDSEPGRIDPVDGTSWPTAKRITITFTAGYGATPAAIPADLRAAVRLLAAHLHEHREASSELNLKEIPFGIRNLIAAHSLRTP